MPTESSTRFAESSVGWQLAAPGRDPVPFDAASREKLAKLTARFAAKPVQSAKTYSNLEFAIDNGLPKLLTSETNNGLDTDETTPTQLGGPR